MQTTDTIAVSPRRAGDVLTRVKCEMARAVNEPNGFWKSLATALATLVIAMLGWFLVDQAQQDREFRQESREYWQQFDRRLNIIESRIEAAERGR